MILRALGLDTRAGVTALALSFWATIGASHGRSVGDPLDDISQRLRSGDRAAIDELLARTRPAAVDLEDSRIRIAGLRAEIERLNVRRSARPVFPLATEKPVRRSDSESERAGADRAAALRESRAWLRAGDPDRALRALPSAHAAADDKDTALYLEARALEGLGRQAEALDAYRRVVATTESTTLRARATFDVAHLEWRDSSSHAQAGRP